MQNFRAAGGEGVEQDAVVVHRDGPALHARGGVDARDLAVAERLEAVNAVPAEEFEQQMIKIFRARADIDLPRLDVHATATEQIVTDCAPQRIETRAGHRAEQRLALVEDDAAHQLRPDGKRE